MAVRQIAEERHEDAVIIISRSRVLVNATVYVGFALAVCLSPCTVTAYTARYSGDPIVLPGGPWRETARDVYMKGNQVCARLRRGDGVFGPPTCTVAEEGHKFANANGQFSPVVGQTLPGGTWLPFSRKANRQGDRVCAQLLRDDGVYLDQCIIVQAGQFFENNNGYFRLRTPGCSSMGSCLLGYVLKLGADSIFCKLMACQQYLDLITCCDPAEPCSNVTWCPDGFAPHPSRYCPSQHCEQARDQGHCCAPIGACSSMRCLRGYAFKLDYQSRFCIGAFCEPALDNALCCDAADPCGNFANYTCPWGMYFNLDEYCDGTQCEEARDRMKCCPPAEYCSNLTCPIGYIPRTNDYVNAPLYCDGARPYRPCTLDLDRDTCCEAAAPCSAVECAFGFHFLVGGFCLGPVVNQARDVPACCRPSMLCTGMFSLPELNVSASFWNDPHAMNTYCPFGYFFNKTDYCNGSICIPDRDFPLCCQPAENCLNLGTCSYGYTFRLDASQRFCEGTWCALPRDLDICCENAARCDSAPCPYGYVPAADWTQVYCDGITCAFPRDLAACCRSAQICTGNFNCPIGYIPRVYEGPVGYCGVGIPGALTCQDPRDLDNCCIDAMPCTNLTCQYGSVNIPDTYCNGTACIYDRDVGFCCEAGLKFQHFRFTPLMLRKFPSDAVQMADIFFYFHGYKLDLSNAQVFTINGSSPINGREDPINLVDGNRETKWLDYAFYTPVYITTASLIVIDAYNFRTGDDEPPRDPIRWRLEASEDATEYVILDEQVDNIREQLYVSDGDAPSVPLARYTETPHFEATKPCVAPFLIPDALDRACAEGRFIRDGYSCTTACIVGKTPTFPTLLCMKGILNPERFACS